MSAMQQVIKDLETKSVFQLGSDVHLFAQALVEIDSRLTALEKKQQAIAGPNVGSKPPAGAQP